MLQNSTDISSSAAVSSFSVPNDFKLVTNGGRAEIDDNRFTIRLKAVYEPERYKITVALNRPESTGAAGLNNGWNVELPDGLTLTDSGKFTMPEADVLLTGRFFDGIVPPPEVYTITYRSGLKEGDAGYTEDLDTPHSFNVTAGADGKADHTVLANDAPELKYVRAGYTFAGWKLTKANPDPNPAPGGRGTVIAPKVYAANGLISGGEKIVVDSSVVLTAQWTENTTPPPPPGTGESDLPITVACNLAILSILSMGLIVRRRAAR